MQCKLCDNAANNTHYQGREMNMGTRDTFDYFQCGVCECLQIAEIPSDMSRYYPHNYYSFSGLEKTSSTNLLKKLRNKFVELRDIYAVTNKGLIGRVLYALRPFTELRALAPYNITKTTSILDVGCGTGHYLYKLKEYGFTNLLGVDPYLDKTITYRNGLTIRKADIPDVVGKWDVIMLHHSLEHMEKQEETLKKVASLLKDDGICLIRIPTVSSIPWEIYRENWVCFEAPRHFFLHSHKSLQIIAECAGLSVKSITFESNPYSFYGSEYYIRNIPASKWKEEEFSRAERSMFAKRAKQVNELGRGDMIAVILHKKTFDHDVA